MANTRLVSTSSRWVDEYSSLTIDVEGGGEDVEWPQCPAELLSSVIRQNEHDSIIVGDLADRLARRDMAETRELAGRLIVDVRFGAPGMEDPRGLDTPGLNFKGVEAFVQILEPHPGVREGRQVDVGLNVLGPGGLEDEVQGLRLETSQLVAAGILALGGRAPLDDGFPDSPIEAACGAGGVDLLFRHVLLGRPVPLPDVEPWFYYQLPGGLLDLAAELAKEGCLRDLRDAMRRSGATIESARQADQVIYTTSGIADISKLDPPTCCPGSLVRILGSGFGNSPPPDTDVLFPTVFGRCSKAEVSAGHGIRRRRCG